MTYIKASTKRGQAFIASASHSEGTHLADVYSSYSSAKARAFRWCYQCHIDEGGRNFHITSHNTFGFSVAWEVAEGIRIETPKNSYLVLYSL